MRRVTVWAIVLGVAPAAFAGFTVTNPGPVNSTGPVGDAGNGSFQYAYGGPDFELGTIVFQGNLTSGGVGSYLSEARWALTGPNGVTGLLQPTTGQTWTGTVAVGPISVGGGYGLWDSLMIGTWKFEAYESYNDTGLDAYWTDVSWQFNEWVPVPPPVGAIDLGVIADIGPDPDLVITSTLAAAEIKWYKFTIAEGAVNPGKYLDIDTEGSLLVTGNDTEIALYSASGLFLKTDDDDGSGLLSQLTFGDVGPRPAVGNGLAYNGRDGALAAGTYYLAVGGYNSTFSDGFTATSASTYTGDLSVRFGTNLVPEPASLALLVLGGLFGIRRRR